MLSGRDHTVNDFYAAVTVNGHSHYARDCVSMHCAVCMASWF